jgi:hypothetical protein
MDVDSGYAQNYTLELNADQGNHELVTVFHAESVNLTDKTQILHIAAVSE